MSDAESTDKTTDDAGEAEVQQKFDRINAQGYDGNVPDPTPNEAYTVAGVTSNAPTPATDEGLAIQAARNANVAGTVVPPGGAVNAGPEPKGKK